MCRVGAPARLIFIRHADINCSLNGTALLCGSHDAPLSPNGHRQVESLRSRLSAASHAAALYSSPLRRAVETARAAPPELLDRIRLLNSLAEIHCGTVEGVAIEEVRRRYPELWTRNEAQADDDFRWPGGGESYRRFRRRVLRAVCSISALHPDQCVLVVTHAGVVNQVLNAIAGQPAACWEKPRPRNCSLTEVLWEGGTGRVECFDDVTHLVP